MPNERIETTVEIDLVADCGESTIEVKFWWDFVPGSKQRSDEPGYDASVENLYVTGWRPYSQEQKNAPWFIPDTFFRTFLESFIDREWLVDELAPSEEREEPLEDA